MENTCYPQLRQEPVLAPCMSGDGAASGSFYSYNVLMQFVDLANGTDGNKITIRNTVEIDGAGGFLLESINVLAHADLDYNITTRLDLIDVQNNRAILKDVCPTIFGDRYRGRSDALPRPVFFPPNSTIELVARNGFEPVDDNLKSTFYVQLNGWRYRGEGEGPTPGDAREQLWVYVVQPGDNLVTDQDSDFVCTQICYPNLRGPIPARGNPNYGTYNHAKTVQLKSDRTQLFREPVPLQVFRRRVGDLDAMAQTWRFEPRSNIIVDREDAGDAVYDVTGTLVSPLPLHFVGYKRFR